jgi:short-subunit dehydrogenase
MFATNVLGTTDCVHAAVPVMKRQEPRGGWRGQVMMVSSVVARRGLPFYGVYSATKAAQLSLAEALRVELRSEQIAVTSVHPIGTETEFGDAGRKAAGHNLAIKQIRGEYRQSAETVAFKMIRGIEKPRPEVWPFGPTRFGVGIATMVPGFVDRIVSKRVLPEKV